MESEGYEPVEYNIEADLNGGWYIGGNFILGGLIGWIIVDPATGAMWKLDKQYYLPMKEQMASASSDDVLKIALASAVPPHLLTDENKIQ